MKLIVKNMLFTIFIPGTVAVYIPLLLAHGHKSSRSELWIILGLVLLVMGCAIYLWTIWDFSVSGKGTPLPSDAPRQLMVRGLYQYLRNPMYLGVLLVILGWAVFFKHGWLLIYALCIGSAFHLFVIYYEEPQLKRLYGADYEVYCSQVNRWLPRLRARGER